MVELKALLFEDSGNGVLSSAAAGLTTLVTVNDYTLEYDFSQAVLVVDQLGEPESGFQVLQGEANRHQYVTMDLLHEVHSM